MAAQRRKQATRGNAVPAWPAWVWVGFGMLLGMALMAAVLWKDWAPMLRKKNLPQPNPEATAQRETEPALADETGKPRDNTKSNGGRKTYDFYSVLPEMEVVIPDAELSAKARAEAAKQAAAQGQASTAPTEAAVHYLLQTGSYPDAKAADEVKAKLALLGFVARVQPVTIDNKTWHRVRVGPYASASELETAKKSLADNGIVAIALKENGTR